MRSERLRPVKPQPLTKTYAHQLCYGVLKFKLFEADIEGKPTDLFVIVDATLTHHFQQDSNIINTNKHLTSPTSEEKILCRLLHCKRLCG